MVDKSVLKLINQVAADPEHKNDISVLRLMCGTGKSFAISQKIRETIEKASETGDGLLIVTDRKDRMDDYMHPHDDTLKQYLQEHENQVTIMNHDTLDDAYRTYKYRPVLMVTTQRFFRLSAPEIEDFLQWEKGNRPLILIDERPELATIVELNEEKIHNSIIAVQHVIGGPFAVACEIEDTESALCSYTNALSETETVAGNSIYCFWSWFVKEKPSFYADAYDIAYDKICHQRDKINQYAGGTYYEDFFTRIKAIHQLKDDLALFYRRQLPTKVILNSFFTLLNNTTVLKDLSAKTIILDGTADLSPEYSLLSCVIHDCPEYSRKLENLKIHIVNLPTGKSKMSNRQHMNYVLECVNSYFDEKVLVDIKKEEDKKYAFFTYKGTEWLYKKEYNKTRVEHFGNIVGKNDFREAKHIIQVGINRYPDAIYYLFYLALHPQEKSQYENMMEKGFNIQPVPDYPVLEELESMGLSLEQYIAQNEGAIPYHEIDVMDYEKIQKQSEEINQQISKHQGEVQEIMNRMLLAELEQNLFRGIIRNSNCKEEYHFHLFINTHKYETLIEMMKQRYIPLGAQIVFDSGTSVVLRKIMNRQGNTYAKAFINWHDNKLSTGDSYTPELIRNSIGIKRQGDKDDSAAVKRYEQLLRSTPILRKLLETEKDEAQKRGLYKKKKNWYYK